MIRTAAVSLLFVAGASLADQVTIGTTYPIAEQDALSEIEARVSGVDWGTVLDPENVKWSATEGHRLPRASEDRQRRFVPWYTTEFDVTDAEGRVIYPRGFQFNVLNHVFLPYRIVVIDPRDASWASGILRPTDMVILTGGDFRELSESLDRSTFILDDKTRRRLGVEAVPSIVTQVRNEFVIEEFLVEEES